MGVEALALASVASSLAGAGISAYSNYQQGAAQKQMANYNASLAANQAKQVQAVAAENASRQRDMARRQLSSMRSRMAAGGVSTATGSSLDTLGNAASDLELQTLDAFRESEARQTALRNQANMSKWQGQQAGNAGSIGAVGSLINGTSGLASNLYSMRYSGTI